MNSYSIMTKIVDFINELFTSLDNGYLFFGSTWDIVRYAIDIVLISLLFYWTLYFLKHTRAWQLIKGVVLIVVFVLICSIIGLDMVGFLFNKLLYVFAILFVVIFQPELRRALETVGLKFFSSFKNALSTSEMDEKSALTNFICQICSACRDMSRTNTGALILIERTTRLDELLTQENVVKFESTVTSSVLQSIFYKGSPMHDGGVLIRNGKIIAARCHVPLSITMHTLERSGTRHRAAVGASEMGDTVVVVVSEERGKTSIAVNGRLFEMKNDKELEANLSYLLGLNEVASTRKGFGKVFDNIKMKKAAKTFVKDETTEGTVNASSINKSKTENKSSRAAVSASKSLEYTVASFDKPAEMYTINELQTAMMQDSSKTHRSTITEKVILMVISLVMSLSLWMYIQITSNPVITKTITVPITYTHETIPDNLEISYPIDTVQVTVVGRQDTIDSLSSDDIIASIDFTGVSDAGVTELPVVISSNDSNIYFRVEQQIPETVSVTVYGTSN